MVYLVKDAAKLCCLVLTDPPLLMTNCPGLFYKTSDHNESVLIVVFEGAIGLHRLLIEWCFSLLLTFCRLIHS